MVVLLALPVVIELVTRGIACRCAIEGRTHVLWCILADGEMLALAWLPYIITTILLGTMKPVPLPPEQEGGYVPRRQRHATEQSGGWFWKNIPAWMSESGVTPRTAVGARKVSFSYNKYSRKEKREPGRRVNRRLAVSLRLVTITCMAASSID
jgi:hypothetical protein